MARPTSAARRRNTTLGWMVQARAPWAEQSHSIASWPGGWVGSARPLAGIPLRAHATSFFPPAWPSESRPGPIKQARPSSPRMVERTANGLGEGAAGLECPHPRPNPMAPSLTSPVGSTQLTQYETSNGTKENLPSPPLSLAPSPKCLCSGSQAPRSTRSL